MLCALVANVMLCALVANSAEIQEKSEDRIFLNPNPINSAVLTNIQQLGKLLCL